MTLLTAYRSDGGRSKEQVPASKKNNYCQTRMSHTNLLAVANPKCLGTHAVTAYRSDEMKKYWGLFKINKVLGVEVRSESQPLKTTTSAKQERLPPILDSDRRCYNLQKN